MVKIPIQSQGMSSVQGYSSSPTQADEPEDHAEDQRSQQHQERLVESEPQPQQSQRAPPQEAEQRASPAHSQYFVQPPQGPPKDGSSEGKPSVIDRNATEQPSFTVTSQPITHNTNRPDEPRTTAASIVSRLGHDPKANTTIDVGAEGRDFTSTATENADPQSIQPFPTPTPASPPNSGRSQIRTPALRALSSSERRTIGPGFVPYDPIRGDNTFQAPYLPDLNGCDGRGNAVVGLNRNLSGRTGIPGPGFVTGPTDRTVVEDGARTPFSLGGAPTSTSSRDWLVGVPVVQQLPRQRTLRDRLKPTVDAATAERAKSRRRASKQSIIINGAIASQVIVGAFTTGIAASGSAHIGTAVAILGGLSTILASYLAKVRGSGEPESSTVRAKQLDSFLREIETFLMDHGDKNGADYDEDIILLREQFEMILKADADNSGGGLGSLRSPPPTHPSLYAVPPSTYPVNGHPGQMPGGYNPNGAEEKHRMYKAYEGEKTISWAA